MLIFLVKLLSLLGCLRSGQSVHAGWWRIDPCRLWQHWEQRVASLQGRVATWWNAEVEETCMVQRGKKTCRQHLYIYIFIYLFIYLFIYFSGQKIHGSIMLNRHFSLNPKWPKWVCSLILVVMTQSICMYLPQHQMAAAWGWVGQSDESVLDKTYLIIVNICIIMYIHTYTDYPNIQYTWNKEPMSTMRHHAGLIPMSLKWEPSRLSAVARNCSFGEWSCCSAFAWPALKGGMFARTLGHTHTHIYIYIWDYSGGSEYEWGMGFERQKPYFWR